MDCLIECIIDRLESEYNMRIIENDDDKIVVERYGFDYGIIQDLEYNCDVLLNFEYGIDDDLEIVEITIRS